MSSSPEKLAKTFVSSVFSDQYMTLEDDYVEDYDYRSNEILEPYVLPSLFSMPLKGKLPMVYTIGFDGKNIVTEYGRVSGKMQVNRKEVKLTRGKDNLYQQSIILIKKMYKDKKMKRYMTLEKFLEEGIDMDFQKLICMTANIYKKDKVNFKTDDVMVQPKLDGFRFKAFIENDKTVMLTRGNEVYERMENLKEEMKVFLENLPENFLSDGEIYIHGRDFSEIQSIITNSNATEEDIDSLRAYIFDIIPTKEELENYPFRKRKELIDEIFSEHEFKYLIKTETHEVKSEEEIEELMEFYRKEGYEGLMIRKGISPYHHGRSNNILKYKEFFTDTGVIIDIEKGEGKFRDQACLVIEDSLGVVTRMIHKDNQDVRKEILANKEKYIGKKYEFSFMERNPKTNAPRHPVGLRFVDVS